MDEVTFLPVIVDYAESSPTAAKEALYTIRKQLDMKNAKQGYQQYNALMLLRILVDNPGPTFTRNFDAKFVSAVKELYRGARDPSVRQLLVENLEYFERKDDPGLQPIKEWYVKEKKGGDFGLRQYVSLFVFSMQQFWLIFGFEIWLLLAVLPCVCFPLVFYIF